VLERNDSDLLVDMMALFVTQQKYVRLLGEDMAHYNGRKQLSGDGLVKIK